MFRNTRTGTLYKGIRVPTVDRRFVWVRSAVTNKLTRVVSAHLEEVDDVQLDLDLGDAGAAPTLDDSLAGEPAEDPGEPDHVALVADGVGDPWADEWDGGEPPPLPVPPPAPPQQLSLPRLPAIHGDLRDLSYNVGSAVALLVEEPENLDVLRVAILMLGDEVDRLRNGR